MRVGQLVSVAAAALGLGLAAAPARADTPWPTRLAIGGFMPSIRLDGGGDHAATAVWAQVGRAPGVYVARRAAHGGWRPAARLGDVAVDAVQLAGDGKGTVAAVWANRIDGTPPPELGPRVAVARRGKGFAPAAAVPLAPRGPAFPYSQNLVDARYAMSPSVAVTSDGTIVVGYLEHDIRAGHDRVVISTYADGHWSAQPFDGDARSAPQLVANSRGGALAAWEVADADGPVRLVASALGHGHVFSAPEVVSDPTRNVGLDATPPTLATNARGDALIAYGIGPVYATELDAVTRTPDGGWGTPQAITTGIGLLQHPSASVGPDGDALVTWSGRTLGAAYRSADGTWSKAEHGIIPASRLDAVPSALDAHGRAVALLGVHDESGAAAVYLRRRAAGDAFRGEQRLTPPDATAGMPSLSLSADGTGVAAWAEHATSGVASIKATDVSVTAPPAAAAHRHR